MMEGKPVKIHTGETFDLVSKRNRADKFPKRVKGTSPSSTNIKSFGVPSCSQCQEQFSSRSLLKIHYENVHTRKLYNCDYCTNWYLYRRSLTRHKKSTHLDIVPNPKCEQCNLKFADTNLLWSHKKAVHLRNLFECSICKKNYTAARSLQRHQRETQHFPSEFHPEPKFEKPGPDHHPTVKTEKLGEIGTRYFHQPTSSDDGNLKTTDSAKIRKQTSQSTNMAGAGPSKKGSDEFPVMLKLDISLLSSNSTYIELLKSQEQRREDAKDMFFLHLYRYKFNE